jgi:hypothetical protein
MGKRRIHKRGIDCICVQRRCRRQRWRRLLPVGVHRVNIGSDCCHIHNKSDADRPFVSLLSLSLLALETTTFDFPTTALQLCLRELILSISIWKQRCAKRRGEKFAAAKIRWSSWRLLTDEPINQTSPTGGCIHTRSERSLALCMRLYI